MANIIIGKGLCADERVALMQQDARFDIADSSACCPPEVMDVQARVRGKGPALLAPKVFLGNDCIFNCAYCGCRAGNDCKRRYTLSPRELAETAVKQAKRGNNGIFLTSAIIKTPNYTEELIIETLRIIRHDLHYGGYVHAKIMPGADPLLIKQAGFLANRLSVNIEVAKSEGYSRVAKNKNKTNILGPMGQISDMIREARERRGRWASGFATSQSTQLMAGSANEDDQTILRLSGALYRKYNLSRVYYTSFQYQQHAAGYDELPFVSTPLWRMQRLYQADRLLKLYGFSADEIAPDSEPFLSPTLDPKSAWALRNTSLFPVEINRADYETLLRIPGIGETYAKRILEARKYGHVSHETLKAIGVSLKRSRHFITCNGRFFGTSDHSILVCALSDSASRRLNEQLSFDL